MAGLRTAAATPFGVKALPDRAQADDGTEDRLRPDFLPCADSGGRIVSAMMRGSCRASGGARTRPRASRGRRGADEAKRKSLANSPAAGYKEARDPALGLMCEGDYGCGEDTVR